MDYNDLWDLFLSNHQQQLPTRFKPVESNGGIKPQFLNADIASQVQNAFSPYDLYLNPDTRPFSEISYPTDAFYSDHRMSGVGIPEIIAMITKASKNNLNPLFPISSSIPPQHMKSANDNFVNSNIPQGIYEHEKRHSQQPGFFSSRNRGYMTYDGMPGNIGVEEARAQGAESQFWNNLFQKKGDNNGTV